MTANARHEPEPARPASRRLRHAGLRQQLAALPRGAARHGDRCRELHGHPARLGRADADRPAAAARRAAVERRELADGGDAVRLRRLLLLRLSRPHGRDRRAAAVRRRPAHHDGLGPVAGRAHRRPAAGGPGDRGRRPGRPAAAGARRPAAARRRADAGRGCRLGRLFAARKRRRRADRGDRRQFPALGGLCRPADPDRRRPRNRRLYGPRLRRASRAPSPRAWATCCGTRPCRRSRATSAATIQLSVPAIAAIGGAMLLAEPITARLLLASAAVLGGIALTIRKKG